MTRYEVTVNVDGFGLRKHVIKARSQDLMAEKLGRAYAKQEYSVMMVKKLRRESA